MHSAKRLRQVSAIITSVVLVMLSVVLLQKLIPSAHAANVDPGDGVVCSYTTNGNYNNGEFGRYNVNVNGVTTMCPHAGVTVPNNGNYAMYDLDLHHELLSSPSSGDGSLHTPENILTIWRRLIYYGIGGPGYDEAWWKTTCQNLGITHLSNMQWRVSTIMHCGFSYYWVGVINGYYLDGAKLDGIYTALEDRARADNLNPSNVQIFMLGGTGSNHQEIIFWRTKTTGKLKITKVVENGPGADAGNNFTFDVTIGSWHDTPSVWASQGNNGVWESGEFDVGTNYSVSEINIPSGWSLVGWSGDSTSGTIQSNATLNLICTNRRDTGQGKVKKSSTDMDRSGNIGISTAGNGYYNMQGITYTLYGSVDNANSGQGALKTFTLQSNGETTDVSDPLPTGTYYAKETSNHLTGYFRDTSVHTVTIEKGITKVWDVSNVPMYGYVTITKRSAATTDSVPKSGFSYKLQGNKDYNRGIVKEATTDANGYAVFEGPLPLGDYTITETHAEAPFYNDMPAFDISLTQADDDGNLNGCVSDTSVSDSSLWNVLKIASSADDTRTQNRQWGYLEVFKMDASLNNAIATKSSFKWYIYKQNKTWSATRDDNTLLGVAQTNQGQEISGTTQQGVAVFMKKDSTGTVPLANQRLDLPVVNHRDENEGYYEIVEVGTTDPWWQNTGVYRVTLSASGNTGDTVAKIESASGATIFKNGVPADGNQLNSEAGFKLYDGDPASNATKIEIPNIPYGHLKAIKKDASLVATATKSDFKWYLYKQNRNWSLARSESNLVGVAQTNQGASLSGTATLGEAVFMKPNGTNPTADQVAELGIKNSINLDDGYYEIVEVGTTDPWWQNTGVYRVVIEAEESHASTGKTKSTITAGTMAATVFKDGTPATNNEVVDELGITVSDSPSNTQKNVQNTTPIEIPNIPYGYLKMTKKNASTGGTVTKSDFKWYLYKQNRNYSMARNSSTLIGVARTNQGVAKSGTATLGEAVFMTPDGTEPTANSVVELAVKNSINLDDGYYEIVEVGTTDPFYLNEGVYRVLIQAEASHASTGKTRADITAGTTTTTIFRSGSPANGNKVDDELGITVTDSPNNTQKTIESTTPVEVPDIPYAYLKTIKKNVATHETITKKQFRFVLYRQNSTFNLPKTNANLIGVAVTSQGADKSGTEALGEAVFMKPDANGNPTNTPVDLPVMNQINPHQGYYAVYETNVVEPFWLTENCYRMTIKARDDNGATKHDITASPDEPVTTIFKNGMPVAKIENEASIKVNDSPTAILRNNENTAVVEIGDDQYAFIEIVKKNMELGKDGATVTQAGFKFKLYDTLANAKDELNALEEITTDETGKAAFKTKLPVKDTARNDPRQGSKRVHIQQADPTNRNDGVYYVRESYAVKPYNKSNAIYRFVISADGNEGNVSYTVDVANFGSADQVMHNNPYTTTFTSYPNGNGIAVHDSTVNGFSGSGVNNVCPTTIEDAPQYGRIKIVKTDAGDGSRQQGAEYQVYAKTKVDYTGAGGDYKGTNQTGNQRTPTAGYDTVADDGGAKELVGYTKLSPHSDGIGTSIGTYSVNTHPDIAGSDTNKIRATANADVAMTVHNLPAGDSSFNETTGKVTVTKPIIFTRADGTQYDTIVTDANGEATTGWLPIDASGSSVYYLVEVRTSNGHVINGKKIEATLTYDSKLQDRECIVSGSDTTNNDESLTQQDAVNGITISKSLVSTPNNPEGGVLAGVTAGFWKTEDDIEHNKETNGTKPQANDGTYSFDSIIIRTPDYASIVPTVHQRITGTELYVKSLPAGYAIRLVDPRVVFNGTQAGYTDTLPSKTYGIEVVNAETDEVVGHDGAQQITLAEGDRTGLEVTVGATTGIVTVNVESAPLEIRASDLTYRPEIDAFVATNLKAGANYEVEFNRQVVKVVKTSSTGGKLWFGRYSTTNSQWFAEGWFDQGAMPTSDSRIITSTKMKVADGEVFTTNTTPLATGNASLHTTDNHSWLQDTSTQRTYDYETVTNASGVIANYRIGAGDYVLAEIKPPVDEAQHMTWSVDTYAHHFTVDDITGYITDTDTGQEDHHEGLSHQVEQSKRFILLDDVTKLRISKREMTDGPEIPGAELVLTSENNDVIDRWVSTDQPHYIEGLAPGWYYLTEYITPKNYDRAETIKFNLLPNNTIQHVIMYDRPISVDAEIDKKQEIASPLGSQDFPNGDSRNRAEAQDNDQGFYAYSLDFRNTSNSWVDEFTVEDPLEPANKGLANLVSLVTPQAFQDYDGKINVWYKTNLTPDDYHDLLAGDYAEGQDDSDGEQGESQGQTRRATGSTRYVANATLEDGHENPWLYRDEAMGKDLDGDGRIIDYTGWKLWKKDLPAAVATKLDVADLKLPEGEYVTGFRFEYGRVEAGFTSRVGGWDDDLLHYEHDDVAKVTGLSAQSFQAADTAVDAAIARMNIVTARFTTDMSFMLEAQVEQQREQAREDYKQKLIDIEEYNRQVAQLDDGTLPKFAEALVVPAYTDDTEETQRLAIALEASKTSLQAAFPLATEPSAREMLLLTARQSVADFENVISQEALDNLNAKLQEYQDEIDRIPSSAGGYDIDYGNDDLLSAFMWALDDIAQFGLSGRTMYAPAVVHMQLTTDYGPSVVLRNSATVDAYRNGGNSETDPGLKTHLTNKATGTHAVGASGLVTVVDEVSYQGLTPGEEYTMSGALHLRVGDEDAGVIVDGDKDITASKTFTPETADGRVTLEFSFHAELLKGCSAVAFEECRMTSDPTFRLMHENIKDGRQTVNENGDVDNHEDKELEGHDRDEVIQTARRKNDIYIGTILTTEDSQKIVAADGSKTVTVIDTVEYHNVIPGRRYRMDGVLHVKGYDSKTKTVIDGGAIKGSKGSATFVPEQADGTVKVKLVMPGSEVLFQPVVAFETLYEEAMESGVASDVIVAEHNDITNADQTVTVTMLAADEAKSPLLKTGDSIALATIGAMTATTLLGVATYLNRNRRI